MIVSNARINDFIAQCHDLASAGYWGINHTVSLVRLLYTFNHIRRLVHLYCRTCLSCPQSRARHNRLRGVMDMPKWQWQSVSMYWTNLPTIKNASVKKSNQVLTVTYRG